MLLHPLERRAHSLAKVPRYLAEVAAFPVALFDMMNQHENGSKPNHRTLIVGGGCFWCQDAVYRKTRGVVESESGYIGGHVENPSYEQISTGTTGHAEAVKVTFDEEIIDADTILDILFASHNPTTLNRQGADVGPQYRSALFPQTPDDKELFERAIERHQQHWSDPIVTTIEESATWWPAEQDHQNFYERNPNWGYCQVVINPKLANVRKHYSAWLQ